MVENGKMVFSCVSYNELCICEGSNIDFADLVYKELFSTDFIWISVFDEKGRVVLWNKGAQKISNFKASEVMNNNIWRNLICLPYKNKFLDLAVKTIIHDNSLIKGLDIPILTKDGDKKILKWYAKRIGSSGEFENNAFIAIGIDVTKESRLQKKLFEERKKFKTYVELANVIFIVVNRHMQIIYANKKAKRLFGLDEDKIKYRFLLDNFIVAEEKKAVRREFEKLLNNGEEGRVVYCETHIQTKEGIKLIAWHNTVVRNYEDEIEVIISAGEDITSKREAEEQLRYLTFHDRLTGLYNRHFFEEELKRLNVKRNYPISIVVVDADNLKLINDTLGHKEGDRFLQNIALALKNSARKDDIVARIGGDEFAVLLCHTSKEAVEKFCQRIKTKCREFKDFGCSVSVGYATANEYIENLEELVALADREMYKDKSRKHKFKINIGILSLVKGGNVISGKDEVVIQRGDISRSMWDWFVKFLESDNNED